MTNKRRKLIDAELEKVGITLQSVYFDDSLFHAVEQFAIEQGFERDGATPDELIQFMIADYLMRERSDLLHKVGIDDRDPMMWLNSYKYNRFDLAHEKGCDLFTAQQ
jgi:hypothetical protein